MFLRYGGGVHECERRGEGGEMRVNVAQTSCRGEFCVQARDAARFLRSRGVDAAAMDEGVLEWRASGSVALDVTA